MSNSIFSQFSQNYSVSPVLVTQYQAAANTRHIVHEVLGSEWPDVTLQKAGPRTGTMSALFDNEGDAYNFFLVLRSAEVLFFQDLDTKYTGMYFVAQGQITFQQDDQNRAYWAVGFPYMEVQT
jgi:hypothetical protein